MSKRFVVGFLFVNLDAVLLLRKRPGPHYVSGRWNGVGGKIEPGESPYGAMIREAREEANIELPDGVRWQQFHYERHSQIHGSLADQSSELFFYVARVGFGDIDQIAAQDPSEPIRFGNLTRGHQVDLYRHPGFRTDNGPGGLVPNLDYLIPMAHHWLTHPSEHYLEG